MSPAPVKGTAGWSTPAPRNRDRRLPEVKDSGIDTGGTYEPGMTRVSWVPEDRRFLISCGWMLLRICLEGRTGPTSDGWAIVAQLWKVITTCSVSEPGWSGAGAHGAREGREEQFSFSTGSRFCAVPNVSQIRRSPDLMG